MLFETVWPQFMGEVVEMGPAVQGLQQGDRVVVSFDICCARCSYCKQGGSSMHPTPYASVQSCSSRAFSILRSAFWASIHCKPELCDIALVVQAFSLSVQQPMPALTR